MISSRCVCSGGALACGGACRSRLIWDKIGVVAHASKEGVQLLQTPGAELPLTRCGAGDFFASGPRRTGERIEIEEFEEIEEIEEFDELTDEDAIFLRAGPAEDVLADRPFGLRRAEVSADYTVGVSSHFDARACEEDVDMGGVDHVAPVDEGLPYIGAQLRVQRRALGWGLADLASETKISVAQLKLIEEGREEGLPGRVFVRGFVRCCARVLDLDGDRLVEHLADPVPAPGPVRAPKTFRRRQDSVGRWTASVPKVRQTSFAVYASMALLVLFVTLFALASDFLSTASVQSL